MAAGTLSLRALIRAAPISMTSAITDKPGRAARRLLQTFNSEGSPGTSEGAGGARSLVQTGPRQRSTQCLKISISNFSSNVVGPVTRSEVAGLGGISILTAMVTPDDGAEPSNEELKDFDHYVGHYAVAVARQALAEGLPVVDLALGEPEDIGKGREDGEAWMFFPDDFSSGLGARECTLGWNEASGWYFQRESAKEPLERRWLGHGLVPDPDRVAIFATTLQVNPDSAGSLERPFYRGPGRLEPELLERLKPYARTSDSYRKSFTRVRNRFFERRLATTLAADPPGEPSNLPLLPGEYAALELILEWIDGLVNAGYDQRGPLTAFARDIHKRRGADAADIAASRTNLAAARAQLEKLRRQEAEKRGEDSGR